jgi:hypothetical protein
MTDKLFDNQTQEPCQECHDTGMMELVMRDLSREPWPCLYCEAGRRVREALDAAKSQGELKD